MGLQNNRINNVVDNALKNMHNLVDANTVIGEPVKTDTGDVNVPAETSGGICDIQTDTGDIQISIAD